MYPIQLVEVADDLISALDMLALPADQEAAPGSSAFAFHREDRPGEGGW